MSNLPPGFWDPADVSHYRECETDRCPQSRCNATALVPASRLIRRPGRAVHARRPTTRIRHGLLACADCGYTDEAPRFDWTTLPCICGDIAESWEPIVPEY